MQPNYVGNNDFRGYLAKNNPGYLSFTGNDGNVSQTDLSNYLGKQGISPYGNDQYYDSFNHIKGDVGNLYSQWQASQKPQPAAAPANPYAAQINQLQGQLPNLDSQQDVGLQNIGNSYNLGANRLDEQNAVARRNYDTSGQQNTQSYLNTRNGVLSNTRSTANALQRLLGLNGSGFSSAALEQAPYAAALQGSQNLNQAQQTYGNNQSALDTNWQDTQRGYGNALQDLNNQKYQQENSLRASIAQTRANLLDRIGQMSGNPGQYSGQINDLLAQITGLGQQYANPVMRTPDVSFAAPNMGQYNLGKFGQPQSTNGNTGAQGSVDPTFLGLLAGQQGRRDQYGNLIAA